MPPHFGVIHTINPLSGLNQCKGSLICFQVVKDIDKGFSNRKVNPYMENFDVQNSFFDEVYQRRMVTGMSQFVKELSGSYGSHAKLSTRRLRRVTIPSHIR